ncbi:hypothetical protein C8Q80DRAFT_1275558 [Daedaleopsis nitida]|nr:hypothetical protein C8Q80DRAFT_1275558 [Daedaleopsis nitida]
MLIVPGPPPVLTSIEVNLLEDLEANQSIVFIVQGIDVTLDTTAVSAVHHDAHRVCQSHANDNYVNTIVYTESVLDPPMPFGSAGDLWVCTAKNRLSLHFRTKEAWESVHQAQFSSLSTSHPHHPTKVELVYHNNRLRWYARSTATNMRKAQLLSWENERRLASLSSTFPTFHNPDAIEPPRPLVALEPPSQTDGSAPLAASGSSHPSAYLDAVNLQQLLQSAEPISSLNGSASDLCDPSATHLTEHPIATNQLKLGHQPFIDRSVGVDALMPSATSTEFPKDHHASCVWWNGMRTMLPFLKEPNLIKRKKGDLEIGDPDVRMVEWAAKSSGDPTLPIDHNINQESLGEVLDNDANYHITPPQSPLEWDETSAERLAGSLNVPVQWHSAKNRAIKRQTDRHKQKGPSVHVTTTMADFLKTADDPTVCTNLLDIPRAHSILPWFIEHVSDDLKAIQATQGDIMDIPHDIQRMRHWALMANGVYITHPHHDTHGLATWVAVTTGGKMWTIFRPRSGKIADVEEILIKMANARDKEYPGAIPENVDYATVPLLPGALLIQAPGTLHMAYTPLKTVALGGHFLTLEMLPQTLLTRIVQTKTEFRATNATHVGVLRSLSRIAISLELASTMQALFVLSNIYYNTRSTTRLT